MKRILSFAYLWILAIPIFFIFTGAASNQLVIAANHDKFPVMLNERKLREREKRNEDREEVIQKIASMIGIDVPKAVEPDDSMLDDVHCVMTKDTHLNFLADWIDLQEAIYSPGDLLMEFGDYIWPFAFPAWFALILNDFRRRQIRD